MPILHSANLVRFPHNWGMDVRTRLRAAIEAKNTNPRRVSLEAGLSDSMVHKFLTGQTQSLTLETLNKIADAVGVDRVWLAYGEGDPEAATELTKVWERIAEEDRVQALRVLETFARTGTDG